MEAAVRGFGGDVARTPASCRSGTDRVAWAARSWEDVEAVLNVQGDEPLVDPAALRRLAREILRPGVEMATLAAPAGDEVAADPHAVQVVRDLAGNALYFSRSDVPHRRAPGPAPRLLHVGVYAYRRTTLLRLASLEPTPLERTEGLEQLRALEHGIPIRVLLVDRAHPGVDTPADARRVERLLLEQAAGSDARR